MNHPNDDQLWPYPQCKINFYSSPIWMEICSCCTCGRDGSCLILGFKPKQNYPSPIYLLIKIINIFIWKSYTSEKQGDSHPQYMRQKLNVSYYHYQQSDKINWPMNKDNQKIDSFEHFRAYETFNKDKFQTPNENLNFGIWKPETFDINPFHILTPSPFHNLPFPTPLNEPKIKRFQDWSLSDLCQNPNVNRNMEIMIEKKLCFNSDEDSQIPNKSPKREHSIQNECMNDENDELYKIHEQLKQKKGRPKDKGLRRLSEKSFEIVRVLTSTTYKQVALKLIDELENQAEILRQVRMMLRQEKEEQNIKRRVYDALNVLIALGILRKERRQIIYDQRQSRNIKKNRQQLEKYQHQLKLKEKRLKEKKQQLKYLRQQYNMQQLIIRNRIKQSTDRIYLPFLAMEFDQHQQGEEFIEMENKSKVKLKGMKLGSWEDSKNLLKYVKNLIYIIN